MLVLAFLGFCYFLKIGFKKSQDLLLGSLAILDKPWVIGT
jgi:hypothetical protein